MNIIALTGNATKDIELKYTKSGTAIANGTIAVRRDFKNQQGEYETDFVNFVIIGKLAEIMSNFIYKGAKFGINGRLQIRIWEKDDGKREYFTEVMVNGFDFPDKKKDNNTSSAPKSSNYTRVDEDPFSKGSGPLEVSDEDLPF